MGYVFNIKCPVLGEGKESYVSPNNPDEFEVDSHCFNTDSVVSISKSARSSSIKLDIYLYSSSNISILVERKYCIGLETYKLLKEYLIDTYDKVSYCMLIDSMGQKVEGEDSAYLNLLKSVGILPPKKD